MSTNDRILRKTYMGVFSLLSSLIRRMMRKFLSTVIRYMARKRTKRET